MVTPLYEKIARDPRHADVKCLNSKTIEARQYPEWSMGFQRMAEADLSDVEGLRDSNKANFNADFLAVNAAVREDLMSHYASWDPLLREVDEGERHVKHLQEVLRRAQGGIEIARLVLEGIVDDHATGGVGDRHAKMCTFALAQLSQKHRSTILIKVSSGNLSGFPTLWRENTVIYLSSVVHGLC